MFHLANNPTPGSNSLAVTTSIDDTQCVHVTNLASPRSETKTQIDDGQNGRVNNLTRGWQ
jgi:hypothetical protein